MQPLPNLLTAAQLADRLGIKTSTVRQWQWQGRIPARKLSQKVVRFDLSEVLVALETADRKVAAQ